MVELEFGDVGVYEGRKTREPGEKPSEQGKNQQQTQPIYDTGPESTNDLKKRYLKIVNSIFLLLVCFKMA